MLVPGPGQIGLSGKGLAGISLFRAGASRQVTAAGAVKLRVAPAKNGKQARKIRRALTRKDKATVRALITFVPTGGVADTRARKLKLVQKTKR